MHESFIVSSYCIGTFSAYVLKTVIVVDSICLNLSICRTCFRSDSEMYHLKTFSGVHCNEL